MVVEARGSRIPQARALVLALCVLTGTGVMAAVSLTPPPQTPTAARRVADRLAALRREAEDLSGREKTLLNELRQLELQRQITREELAAIDLDLKSTQQALVDAEAAAAALRQSASTQQPDIEDRLVRLYKMGRAGYWRLLLDVGDVQSMGRAYRTAAALTRLDRDRVQRHRETLEALDRKRGELQARATEIAGLQTRAAAARATLDRAVASRAAMVESISSQKELTARLAAELDAAHLRLQATMAQSAGRTPDGADVPVHPFKGEMPWPADGIVIQRFGRQQAGRVPGIAFSRNGIELSLAEGQPVAAVHDGVVTQAGPFPGYGQLVIIDHGGGAVSLYGHLEAVSVNKGERLAAGSPVGRSGRNTGGNPALYFELRVDGKPVDPLQWLRRQP